MLSKMAFLSLVQAIGSHANTIPSVTSGCSDACAELEHLVGSQRFHPAGNDPQFQIWDGKQAEVVSACRVEPQDTSEVVKTLEILTKHWCTFAIKGGCHSRALDASKSSGGVTIDMNRFNQAVPEPDRQSAWLGSGLTLFKAFGQLEAFGLTFIGGRVDTVGVAGFTMGGGFSNLTPKHGLAADNVFEYELVLPNATVFNVTHDSNPDLYYALRGGANNFGIITRFRARVFNGTNNCWGSSLLIQSILPMFLPKRIGSLSISHPTRTCRIGLAFYIIGSATPLNRQSTCRISSLKKSPLFSMGLTKFHKSKANSLLTIPAFKSPLQRKRSSDNVIYLLR
ncbi:hypothetical protein VHEMI02066 [[Torrubiella] hemipterigena]|uniref:FAD-binding PCMH-type domain-containing protein n=1 Tax=[Torrubiella] hemipterigena TaxID=1531966 RepID=A0A0A1T727_9HYPO|nr:hypothetical protein VHEMI02066 [[Torrubiella] hemipterigena]